MLHEIRVYLALSGFLLLIGLMRSSAGRLAPRAAFMTLVFLITRRAVLAVWVLGAIAWFALFWTTAIERGRDPSAELPFIVGMSVFLGLGMAALLVGPAWMVYRAFARPPVFELEGGELVLFETSANHFLRGEARGGKLIVTTQRLGFRPHRFNVQLDPWSIPLEAVRESNVEGTRLLVLKSEASREPEWLVTQNPAALVEKLRETIERTTCGAGSPTPRP